MRAAARENGVSVKAYAGTTGVLLAFDVTEKRRKGLLGFAIEREGGNRPRQWLTNRLRFPEVAATGDDGASPSCDAPIQRFRWADYRVYPGTTYSYAVHPVYGAPGALDVQSGPTVIVTTSSASEGEHRVIFNRAAAASQAFARDFPEVAEELDAARREKREPVLPSRALAWLSRGVLEQITGFCARAADPTWALDVAIYEFELPAIVEALNAARERGAEVRIVYHAKPGDEQTEENRHNVRGWPAGTTRERVTNRIFHDKFIVLSRVDGQRRRPKAVLCGSTNFTENGVYRQANVVHVVQRPDTAREFLNMFEILFGGNDPAATRTWIDAHNPLSPDAALSVGFSPRSGEVDLNLIADEIRGARRDVMFCTAFDLEDRIEAALLGADNDDVLRLGIQNKRSSITGFHRDRTANFAATAMLNEGLEGFLKESTAGQRGNILIHTKLIVVDFSSDSPTVISGSHNLSGAASRHNDEAQLIVRGNTDVADCYGVELLRLYEHYRFRWYVKNSRKRSRGARQPIGLASDDGWTDPYFADGSLERADRRCFGLPVDS